MIGLLQRVTEASVSIDKKIVGQINQGLLVLVGVEKKDTETQADRLLERLLSYRVFPDDEGKMNLSLADIKGGLLLVPSLLLLLIPKRVSAPVLVPPHPPTTARNYSNI
jgi:D-tyrosyl-tRNA(Tyr) deacylase